MLASQHEMRAFIAIFLIALTATLVSTPQIRRFALSVGLVDAPDSRKTQQSPMPLLGGLAILVGVMTAVSVAFYVYLGRIPQTVSGVLLSSGIVAAVGLVDDRLQLPAWAKLVGQLIAVLVLVFFGIRVRLPLPDFLNYTLTFVWVAGISNAINFLDNMDGLSAGISAIAASFILLLATINNQFLVAAMSAALLGACLGFLRYNMYPARIYMGDAGSLFLGFLLAVLAMQLRFPENSNFVTWMVPVFILGLPLFDMALVIVSRIRRGISPTTAGRDHVSHRLVSYGLSQREAVLSLYLLSFVSGMVAIFITQATVAEGYFIGVMVLIMAIAATVRMDRFYGASSGEGESGCS